MGVADHLRPAREQWSPSRRRASFITNYVEAEVVHGVQREGMFRSERAIELLQRHPVERFRLRKARPLSVGFAPLLRIDNK